MTENASQNDTAPILETPEIPEIPKSAKIISVCGHGNSRSKFMARAVAALGYEHSRLLGIGDYSIPTAERIATLLEHDLVVCASTTDEASVRKLLRDTSADKLPKIISLQLDERTHATLHLLMKGVLNKEHQVAALDTLKEKLRQLGFTD